MKVEVNRKTGAWEKIQDPHRLVTAAVIEHAAKEAEEGWKQILHVTSISNIDVQTNPKTQLRAIYAQGKGTLQKLKLQTDTLYEKKVCKFDIQFREGSDEWGQPDVDVLKFNCSEL